jgi:hypothetical protein
MNVLSRRLAEDEAFEQAELEARRFAPWSPLSVHSPAAYSPGRSVRAAEVDQDPAAGVMLRGDDRDRLFRSCRCRDVSSFS